MPPATQPTPPSKAQIWAGRILTALPLLFLLVDGVMKLFKPAPVLEGMTRLGYPVSLAVAIGIILLVCVVIYAIPQTSILGAILLTGYLGGATATHVRIHDPFVAPIIVGVLVWLGLWLRDARLRALTPWRK